MKRWYKTFIIYAVVLAVVVGFAYFYSNMQSQQTVKEVEFSDFVKELEAENIKELTLQETSMTATLKDDKKIHAYAPSTIQLWSVNEDYIIPQIKDGKQIGRAHV